MGMLSPFYQTSSSTTTVVGFLVQVGGGGGGGDGNSKGVGKNSVMTPYDYIVREKAEWQNSRNGMNMALY